MFFSFFSFIFFFFSFFHVEQETRRQSAYWKITAIVSLSLSLLSVAITVMSRTGHTYGILTLITFACEKRCVSALKKKKKNVYNLVDIVILANVNCSRAVSFATRVNSNEKLSIL